MGEHANFDDAARFISTLTGEDGWRAPMFFQTFDDSPEKKPRLTRAFIGTLRDHGSALSRLNRDGACVAVAINALRGSRRILEEVAAIRALFIDCDGPRARRLALPTSITVESRAGRHYYWLLLEPAAPDTFADAQRQLAAFYGTDGMVCDATRVMRLPGFDHCKAERFRVGLVRADAALRYPLHDILRSHQTSVVPDRIVPAEGPAEPQNDAVRAFRRWAAAAPRLEGARNATAFAMAAEGFRSGLPPAAVAYEVCSYCERAGIPREAGAVLRSACRHVGRR
ncbi:MAG TPA: DNA-primase RepB domain-containing protein [Thermoanaerobaculia bacterium]|jgi:hypothetical protein